MVKLWNGKCLVGAFVDHRRLSFEPIRRGEIDVRIAQVVRLEPGKAYLNTGDSAEIDMIVFGTG
jgi:hypothetical protein